MRSMNRPAFQDEPFTVLLVEDTRDDEALVLRALRGCSRPLSVRVARDGAQARAALGLEDGRGTAKESAPDLVISDLKLPGLDGQALLRLVRDDADLEKTPFIIYSSSDEPGDVARCMGDLADAYVQKPVGFEGFLDCLRSVTDWARDGFGAERTPGCVVAYREGSAGRGSGV